MRTVLVCALSLVLVLAGCASTPPGTDAADDAAQGASTMAPVQLPAGAARNVVLTLTGPAQITESDDWPEMQREWRETFADHAREAGIAFVFADAPPAMGSREGTLLVADVADFRVVGIGARMFFGVMTGNAFIDATVSYRDLRSGAVFGEQHYHTASSAWHGVFARMTPQQVDAIASQVFESLKPAR